MRFGVLRMFWKCKLPHKPASSGFQPDKLSFFVLITCDVCSCQEHTFLRLRAHRSRTNRTESTVTTPSPHRHDKYQVFILIMKELTLENLIMKINEDSLSTQVEYPITIADYGISRFFTSLLFSDL